jgi:hypothetical protein
MGSDRRNYYYLADLLVAFALVLTLKQNWANNCKLLIQSIACG